MLDSNTFDILTADIEKAVRQRRLLDALYGFRGLSSEKECVGLLEPVEALSEDYSRMLDYWERGVADPERDKIFEKFLRRALELLEQARFIRLRSEFVAMRDGVESIYNYNVVSASSSASDCVKASEIAASTRLFYDILCMPPFDEARYEAILMDLTAERESQDRSLMILSALTLSCLNVFDANKLRLLLAIAQSEDVKLRARSVVGTVLICVAQGWKISLYPELHSQLLLLADEPQFYSDLKAVQLQLLLSLNTKQDSRRMSDEIIPDMMRAFSEAMNIKQDENGRFDVHDSSVFENLDFNPDWMAGGNDAMKRTMEEFISMQEKGADLFYRTFSTVSRRYPFFRTAANWFMPFTFEHPVFEGRGEELRSIEFILNQRKACDTEGYAYCFIFSSLPADNFKSLVKNLELFREQYKEMEELESSEEFHKSRTAAMQEAIRSYVQDLFRFFTLYMHRGESLLNPFTLDMHLNNCEYFEQSTGQTDFLLTSADYCFSEKSWGEALSYLENIPEQDKEAEIYEKMGYCCYRLNDYGMAAEYFERANMIRPGSRWTLRQLAKAYITDGKYKDALVSLLELERMDAENVETLLRLGECYILMRNSEIAFEKLYKADYIQPSSQTQRALAWCSLVFQKPQQAYEYYTKLLAQERDSRADLYNAAHAAWVNGNILQAITHYLAVLRIDEKDFAPDSFFDEDRQLLHSYGLTDSDITFMRDSINRTLTIDH